MSCSDRGKVTWLPARENRLLSQANCSVVFLATNALSDAVSIRLAGLQDTSLQLLLGNVTDVCRVLAKRERPARSGGWLGAGGSPALLGMLVSVRGAESLASELAALLPTLELVMCVTGQVISSFASNNLIMAMTSAAVHCRTNLSNPKPNTEGGWVPDRAELLQPFLAGKGGCDVQVISFPLGYPG